MNKLEYMNKRIYGIGGSDVGAIMGVNKWKSPFEVYMEKRSIKVSNAEENSVLENSKAEGVLNKENSLKNIAGDGNTSINKFNKSTEEDKFYENTNNTLSNNGDKPTNNNDSLSSDQENSLNNITSMTKASEAAYWGETLKEIIAKEFSIRTGKKVRKCNKYLADEEYPFMIGAAQRRVVSENSILMCKTANTFLGKQWDGEEIPPSYLLQSQHYMRVYKADKCYIGALIGGQKFVLKEIPRDEELISMIIEAEKDFWINHVEKAVPPIIDGSEAVRKYLTKNFIDVDAAIEVNLKDAEKIEEYLKLKEEIKTLEDSMKAIENNLKNEIGHAERGIADKFLVIWKGIISSRVDVKLLKADYPEVYKAVAKRTKSRRFEVKELAN